MIIHDLDVVRVPVLPDKANAVLIVDADRVLPGPIASEPLQPIARRNQQFSQIRCGVEDSQLLPGRLADGDREPTASAGLPERSGVAIGAVNDQSTLLITQPVHNVNRYVWRKGSDLVRW